ncbi:dTDP-4-dehydrorhamnose 3,5-epimerase family protein [Flavobacterium lindanitolerans]|uniref:dTDP-4-dehydrorhamnose 3,5-epimerase family protein n=1 Tax=Flavobacterium lindanitolerans TaxID=428988 RepID=UPI0028086375|nr:dTDP-4-dehydrorhamnose 3,5-epimerase family protein [Flavobacterium lindanitolerans]MDQ7960979.1 WxcM-like domain-containing protein [Flavobacterium lindanitolerans]
MKNQPQIIQGNIHEDERGKLFYVNEFDLSEVKRYYIIEHPDILVIRAWQAHKREQKWFQVISGSFVVAVVQPDDWENPSEKLEVREFVLNADENQILHIPGNFANGFKALEKNSKMIVFSDFSLEESSKDNFRFDSKLWFDWN